MCISIKRLDLEERKLVVIKPIEDRIPYDVYAELEGIIWDEVNKLQDPEGFMEPYMYPFEKLEEIANSDNFEYKESIRVMADDLWSKEEWLNALLVYYILMHIVPYMPTDFYKLAYSLAKLHRKDEALKLIKVYEPLSVNKKVTCHAIGNFYYTALDMPLRAIEYFEKYTEFDPENANVYNTLGHLYSRVDDEVSRKKQTAALLKADELKPNDPVIVKSLLTMYEKRHDTEKVKKLYPKLISISPSPRHSLNYGLYLMSWGELNEGGKYFAERFDLEKYPVGYPKTFLNGPLKWNFKDDISDKLLVVHYEEGFGDSIMYGRFLPLLKQYARKTVLIVQKPLANLFKQSPVLSDGVEILTDIKEFIGKYNKENYTHIPMLDMPYPLGVDRHFIPFTDKYLVAQKPKKYDNKKVNIGIAYSGDASANYNGRDIMLTKFYDIAKLDGVQVYSLQVGDRLRQIDDVPKDISIVDLGKDFKDFTDTANAVAGLDLVISSDNVILNLAGALGVRTYGVFNKYPNYRWFDLTGDNVVWYESVKPFQCEEENDWASVMEKVKEAVVSEFLNK